MGGAHPRLSVPDFTDLKRSVCLDHKTPMRKNDFTLGMLLRLGRVHRYGTAP